MSVWTLGRSLRNVTVSPWYRHREVNPATLLDINGEGAKSDNESNGDEEDGECGLGVGSRLLHCAY
jgi:hypothetical protein